jgi:hypothetical protein
LPGYSRSAKPVWIGVSIVIRLQGGLDGVAARGNTSRGWRYGFKRHLIITRSGESIAFRLGPGNVDDRTAWSKRIGVWAARYPPIEVESIKVMEKYSVLCKNLNIFS